MSTQVELPRAAERLGGGGRGQARPRAALAVALDRAEDPRETLDYSYQRQLEMLSKVRRGVAQPSLTGGEDRLRLLVVAQDGGEPVVVELGRELEPGSPDVVDRHRLVAPCRGRRRRR